jgi:hypothetical protein
MPLVRNDAVENVGTLVLRHHIADLQRQVSYLRPECADFAVIAALTRLLPSRPWPGGIRDSTGIGYPSSISLRLASRPGGEVVDGGVLGVGLGAGRCQSSAWVADLRSRQRAARLGVRGWIARR